MAPAPERHSFDEMHLITQKPSQASLASATVVPSSASNSNSNSNEKEVVASAVSCPPSAHSANLNPFDTDMEAAITHTDSATAGMVNTTTTRGSKKGVCGEATVWPGQAHWKKKAKEQKIQRSRTCLSRLSKRNRMVVKILLVLFVLGIAVGVGLGISKPLGASIWGQKKSSS